MSSIALLSGTAPAIASPPMPTSLVETCAQKTGRIAYLILSILILPIGLVRPIGYMFHQIALRNGLVPMCGTLSAHEKLCHMRRIDYLVETEQAVSVLLPNPYGEQLHGVLIPGKKHPEKVALLVCPNNTRAGSFLQSRINEPSAIKDLGISAFAVDYAGVGLSEGTTSLENLSLTVYSSLHYLVHENGIRPEDIVVYGWSLGGAAAAVGTALFEEENPGSVIPIAHERSFTDLLTEIGELLGGFARFTAWTCGFQIDSKDSFDKLKGKKLIVHHINDETIPYAASLAKAIAQDVRYKKTDDAKDSPLTVLEMQGYSNRPHLMGFSSHESDAIAHKIASMLHIDFTLPEDHKSPPLTHYAFTPL